MEKKNRVSFLKFLIFELVTMIILVLISKLLESIAGGLLYTTGHKALTSGDIPFLFTCWQGWVIIIISFFVLLFYTLFDVNAVIIMSDNELNNKGKSMWAVIKEAFASIRFFGHPTGVFLVIYISLLAPLCGAGAGISLTEGFAIPDFIMLVIRKNTLIYVFYIIHHTLRYHQRNRERDGRGPLFLYSILGSGACCGLGCLYADQAHIYSGCHKALQKVQYKRGDGS